MGSRSCGSGLESRRRRMDTSRHECDSRIGHEWAWPLGRPRCHCVTDWRGPSQVDLAHPRSSNELSRLAPATVRRLGASSGDMEQHGGLGCPSRESFALQVFLGAKACCTIPVGTRECHHTSPIMHGAVSETVVRQVRRFVGILTGLIDIQFDTYPGCVTGMQESVRPGK